MAPACGEKSVFVLFGDQVSFGTPQFNLTIRNYGTAIRFIHTKIDDHTGGKFKGHLHGVGDGAIIIEHILASLSIDRDGSGFAQHPSDGIHIVHTPIPHLRGIIFPPAKRIGSDIDLKRPVGSWTQPHIPIKPGRRFFALTAANTIRKHVADTVGMCQAHFADPAVLHFFGQLLIDLRPTAVEADLDDSIGFCGGLDHFPAFAQGDGQRFFHIDILASVQCLNGLNGGPVVGGGNADGIDILSLQQFAKIFIPAHLSELFLHLGNTATANLLQYTRTHFRKIAIEKGIIYIAQSHDLDVVVGNKTIQKL